MATMLYREALNAAMCEEMARDPNIFLMGEEVGEYQGAYKVSQGMLQKFGARRVVDTPIVETGFAGIGIGAAMTGLRPIIEFMTFNFSLVAIDQIINNAAKIRQMSGGQFKVPIVFRGAGGAAGQLAAQHSQSLESYYVHCPGLKVVMPSTPKDAKGLLKTAIRDDNPVIFIESELLYGSSGEVPEGEYLIPLGVADVKREGSDVTIVTYSKMVHVSLAAAAELSGEGVSVEVVDVRTLRPLDLDTIVASVKKTSRCVVVQEGWPMAGMASELAFQIQEAAFGWLDAPVARVTNQDVPTPYAKNLEAMVAPSAEKVVAAVKRVMYAGGE
jgi:pyruvate dehydrogenase E1 component beta subunit